MRPPLRTLLGDHPATQAVRRGAVVSPVVPLDFADVAVPNRAFKRVVRDLEFDVAELALMTFLMARSRGVPLRLLPVVVFSRNPLPHLVRRASDALMPGGLPGSRVGVRAYATTTAVWIRAMLADEYRVPADSVKWMTLEDGHVADVPDPPGAQRAAPASDLTALLRDGLIDAAIVDRVAADESVLPVVPDPQLVCRNWQRRHGARPLNHVIVVRETVAEDEQTMRELFGLFRSSRELAGNAVDRDATPLGLEANRRNLEVAIDVAAAQGLLARPLTVDDLVTDAVATLQ